MIEIVDAGPSEFADIADLYAEADYGAAINQADTILVAKSLGQVIGVVRLCAEQGVTVLRGMQIRRAFQRQGVGSKLLAGCEPYLNERQSFCLPYAHLVKFYAAAQFEVVTGADLPTFLMQRLSAYREKGKNVLAMRRNTLTS